MMFSNASIDGKFALAAGALALALGAPLAAHAAPTYQLYVTNERSGDVTVINGGDFSVADTIAVGQRPRGIHVSPDGKTVYVAVSGTPIAGPPQPDAKGEPVPKKSKTDDDDHAGADKSSDGIAMLDVASRKLRGKITGGSDPEEFALSKDGSQIYVSNEDTKSVTVIGIAKGKVEHVVPVGLEPEGVTTTPDGKHFYVTCEAAGEIYVIDTATYTASATFKVEGRPRSVDFLADGSVGFIPSETAGQLNIIDAVNAKVLKTITLPEGSRPMRVKIGRNSGKVYLTNGRGGTVSVLDPHSYALVDTIKVGARPWGVALSPDGKFLFTANGPSNDVSVVDLATNKEIMKVKAGSSPWGVAIVSAP